MDIHQCMTCGERWGHGTIAAGKRVEAHRKQGHRVLIGDDAVLDRMAAEQQLAIVRPTDEPIVLYHCLDCQLHWGHGTEDAYQTGIEHTSQGHHVIIGEDPRIRRMTLADIEVTPQAPNPTDPTSQPGGGTLMLFGEAERV